MEELATGGSETPDPSDHGKVKTEEMATGGSETPDPSDHGKVKMEEMATGGSETPDPSDHGKVKTEEMTTGGSETPDPSDRGKVKIEEMATGGSETPDPSDHGKVKTEEMATGGSETPDPSDHGKNPGSLGSLHGDAIDGCKKIHAKMYSVEEKKRKGKDENDRAPGVGAVGPLALTRGRSGTSTRPNKWRVEHNRHPPDNWRVEDNRHPPDNWRVEDNRHPADNVFGSRGNRKEYADGDRDRDVNVWSYGGHGVANRNDHRRPFIENGPGNRNDKGVYWDGNQNRQGDNPRGYDSGNSNDRYVFGNGSNDRERVAGRRNVNGGNDGTKVFPIGYRKLEELSQNEPNDLVPLLAVRQESFFELLKVDLKPDLLALVVKVLSKVCQVDFIQNKIGLLANSCDGEFIKQIGQHIASIPTDNNPARQAEIPIFFHDLLIFCESIISMFPSTACEHFGPILMLTKGTIATCSSFRHIAFGDSLAKKLEELETQLFKLLEERQTKSVKETTRSERLKHQPPPDNFREISIFPQPEEILSRKPAFVRPNIVEGAYASVEHYLDVQFRLLREDFVWPLRMGITSYLEHIQNPDQKPNHKNENITIYENVTFLSSHTVDNKIGVRVSFQQQKKTHKVNWEYSKRLMFGSLLVFSNNNFKTIIFGTIMDRKLEDLKLGYIGVEFPLQDEVQYKSKYTMVESEIYFEPYYHVLKALQKMKGSEFPMSRYIVKVNPTIVPPEYILNAPENLFKIEEFKIPLLVRDAWPSAIDLQLDESQFRAFQSALTQEFVVIQGPPGTGKTYLGLRIAKALITNMLTRRRETSPNEIDSSPDSDSEHSISHEDCGFSEREDDSGVGDDVPPQHTPILVVCFTNHALDQFLEGLLPTTKKLVRIGGQSKNTALEEYNLRNVRWKSHDGYTEFRRLSGIPQLSRNIRGELSTLLSDIKGIQGDLELLKRHWGIVSINAISMVYNDKKIGCFMDDSGELSDQLFLDWLTSDVYETGNVESKNVNWPPEDFKDAANDQDEDEDKARRQIVDDIPDIEQLPANFKLEFALRLPHNKEAIDRRRDRISYLHSVKPLDPEKIENEEMMLNNGILYCNLLRNMPQQDIDNAAKMMGQHENLWWLTEHQRWPLYLAWVERLKAAMVEELRVLEDHYRTLTTKLQETQLMEDLKLLRTREVVGMTTTGAARLQPLLQALRCRVVIVEEAAEVLESHIVVSLTNYCEHLILIGDHQQLRPTTAVYRLARDFHFDISLFERMLRNGVHCEVLKVQHRMRPEIARMIVPSIYKELHNHESVLQFKPVRGVGKNVFFLTHSHWEEKIGETHSRQNTFEADFLLGLCRYLLMQGYAPERITILATYSGQLFYMRNKRAESPALSEVQITIVDNFQGEENDIILLSLVRNNETNDIGFLKTENRVCVALSRAKHGLFIMGNMDNLTHCEGVWCKIKATLEEDGALGEGLPVYCVIHQDQMTYLRCPNDFKKVPEGGCLLPCEANLVCGHICVQICHVKDREHIEYKCRKPCTRTPPNCGLLHPCPKLCYECCGDCLTLVPRELPCGHNVILHCYIDYMNHKCTEKVEVTSEVCGHTFDRECHQKPDEYRCPLKCDIRLDCGHTCSRNCHVADDPNHEKYECRKPCAKKNVMCTQDHMCTRTCHEECGLCCIKVKKQAATCDHVYTVDCSLDPAKIVCKEKCKKMLPCGHPCPLKCFNECGNCKVMVQKTVEECGHKVKVECSSVPQRKQCGGVCQRPIACGHLCNRTCNVACLTGNACTVMVPTDKQPACGHTFTIPCNLRAQGLRSGSPDVLQHCTEPCNMLLECDHRCTGTCGQCMQGRFHQECQVNCGRNLICGHSCKVPCARTCPPCRQKCNMRCSHSRCNNKCGIPCQRCNEKCDWKCKHMKCTKPCWELCNREPCKEPCERRLKCKHPCIGFCGEPCPPLCRECDHEQVTTIIFGNEDNPEARFIYLEDCKHMVESDALETWLTLHREEVTIPQCPLCKTNIMTTMRFMNQIKLALKDIQSVKKKIFGNIDTIKTQRRKLLVDLLALNSDRVGLIPCGRQLYDKLYHTLYEKQSRSRGCYRNRYKLSSEDLRHTSLQLEFFMEVQKLYKDAYPILKTRDESLKSFNSRADRIIGFLFKSAQLNAQGVADTNLELLRLQRTMQFSQLNIKALNYSSIGDVDNLLDAGIKMLNLIARYSPDQDKIVLECLQKLERTVDQTGETLKRERKEIVAAIGLSQGHWFKCPNGHFYAIGECGGAMVEAKCIECKATIGGSQHRLRSDNRLAREMDGATHSAWPGGAI